jgi:ankyrin repeat protein
MEQKTKKFGYTALHVSIRKGHSNLVDLLMSSGADILALSATGYSILHLSILSVSKEMPKFILDYLDKKGDDSKLNQLLHTADENGYTALHCACLFCQSDLACRLINRGSNLRAESREGETPLHKACRSLIAQKQIVKRHKIVQHLINKGAPTDVPDHSGSTPLHVAASNGDEDSLCLVKCLVNNKADVNAQNLKGETPLHLAHKSDVIDFLLKNGANN